jgi:hypothetical protein
MPYVAPEVLSGKQLFTQKADIYRKRLFDGYKFDTNLAVSICKGEQLEFAPGTPNCYVELAK